MTTSSVQLVINGEKVSVPLSALSVTTVHVADGFGNSTYLFVGDDCETKAEKFAKQLLVDEIEDTGHSEDELSALSFWQLDEINHNMLDDPVDIYFGPTRINPK